MWLDPGHSLSGDMVLGSPKRNHDPEGSRLVVPRERQVLQVVGGEVLVAFLAHQSCHLFFAQ